MVAWCRMPDRPSVPKTELKKTHASEQTLRSEQQFGPETSFVSQPRELVVLTGLSGAGKQSALRTFEDLGYYAVDNLPLELVPQFAALIQGSAQIARAALVVDAREETIEKFPYILKDVSSRLNVKVLFLEATNEVLVRRYSETRRPHPFRSDDLITASIAAERSRMAAVRNLADVILDTSRFNVHELRAHLVGHFGQTEGSRALSLSTMSFGFRNGIPPEADMVFDVRFLPNPHFVPKFRPLTGQDLQVAEYVRSFPQTQEFLKRVGDLLLSLLPQFEKEGKSYLTIAFGCTGGQHRSVALAEYMGSLLSSAGYTSRILHRDMPR